MAREPKIRRLTVGHLVASLQKLDPKMEVMGFDGIGLYVRLRSRRETARHLAVWKVWDLGVFDDDHRHRASICKNDRFADDPKAPPRQILGIG